MASLGKKQAEKTAEQEAPPIFRWAEAEGDVLTPGELTALDEDGPEWRETVEDGVVDEIWRPIAAAGKVEPVEAPAVLNTTPWETVRDESLAAMTTAERAEYDAASVADETPPAAVEGAYSVMQWGSTGEPVGRLQAALNRYYPGLPQLEVTQEYDAATKGRVEYFQRKHSFDVDGVAGPRVASALGLL